MELSSEKLSVLQPLAGLLRTMRPKQWTKNVIVYAGLVFDGQLFNGSAFLRVTVSFFLLCLVASTIYIINDLIDIERDRQHPQKRLRPLPSGMLPVPMALLMAILLPLFSIIVACTYNLSFAFILVIYITINLLYCFRLKHIVLLDLLAIASGYVLRVACGVVVISGVNFSPWLYTVIALLALFLAISKRRQELVLLGTNAARICPIFKDYNLNLLDEMLRIVSTSTLVAYIIYAIELPSSLLSNTNLALSRAPFCLHGLSSIYLFMLNVISCT